MPSSMSQDEPSLLTSWACDVPATTTANVNANAAAARESCQAKTSRFLADELFDCHRRRPPILHERRKVGASLLNVALPILGGLHHQYVRV